MPLRLLACDLDGTVAGYDGQIPDISIDAITRARRQGILVVIATGRLLFAIETFLDRLQVTDEPVITGQGALIVQRNGLVLRRLTLDPAIAHEAAEIATRLGAGMAYFDESDIVVDRYVYPQAQYQAWFGGHATFDPDALSKLDGRLIKFMAIHPDLEAIPNLVTALRQAVGDRADITRSWHHFVEGTTPGADKGAALAWLCARLDIDRSEVIAIGDGGNDVTMLKWAGFSAAPADASAEARAAAQWLAPPLAEHPVAAALAHFLGW